ncbi:MAG: hypothetical protein RIS84_1082 [Pseudomonadota bacterium]|jgi:hypothetical protein
MLDLKRMILHVMLNLMAVSDENPKVFLTPFNCAPKSPKGDFKDKKFYV